MCPVLKRDKYQMLGKIIKILEFLYGYPHIIEIQINRLTSEETV